MLELAKSIWAIYGKTAKEVKALYYLREVSGVERGKEKEDSGEEQEHMGEVMRQDSWSWPGRCWS